MSKWRGCCAAWLPVLLSISGFSAPSSVSAEALPPAMVKMPMKVKEEEMPADTALQMSPVTPNGYLARINLNSPEEVEKALLRVEQLFREGKAGEGESPLAFVLHGPEVDIFLKRNYEKYKSIVDLAARLSAFQVVDINVCETRMGVMGEDLQALLPFVDTVPFGPSEIKRLLKEEEYVYF